MDNFWGNVSYTKLYLLYKRELLESCMVPNLEIHVEVYL
jgi:hypothetical protein